MRASPEEIADAVARLRRGGIVAFPTETVYGLGADAFDEEAIRRVFALKGRPASNPLIVHVADVASARAVVADWPREAQLLADAFWPGPLSIVLPKSARVPAVVTGGGPNVAVRCPNHAVALALLWAFGGPLVGPSANPSGGVSPTESAHVRDAFSEEEVYVVDGGPCRAGIESTVVSLAGPIPVVLRPGLIGPEMIAAVLGRPVASAPGGEAGGGEPGDGPAPSPGMLASHYAPRTPAVLFGPGEWPRVLERGAGRPVAIVSHRALEVPPPHELIRMPSDAAGYGAELYRALRRADAAGAALIAIDAPPDPRGAGGGPREAAAWHAIADRLRRATAGRG